MNARLGLDQGVIRRAKSRVWNAREWTTTTGKCRRTGHVSTFIIVNGQNSSVDMLRWQVQDRLRYGDVDDF